MNDFDFISPTRVVFGRNSEEKVGELCLSFGFKKVLLVYGGGSIKRSGLYDKVIKILNETGIEYVDFGGISPNPDAVKVREGVALARASKIDSILAIGGGSVIDSAKSIGVGFYYEGDPFDFNLKKAKPTKTLPLGCILTIASAGSELSNSCVIQDDETQIKQGFNDNLIRPVFAIENPELTYTVSPYQTAAGASDTIMHSLERFHNGDEDGLLCDDWALSLIASTMKAVKAALEKPCDYEARATLILNSSLSHNGLTGLGKPQQFVVHPLEHVLSGYKKEITHGAGVALLYPAWAEHVYASAPRKFAKLAETLFQERGANEAETAIMGIRSMKAFFHSIGMPTTFREVGLGENDISALVRLASGNGTRVIGRYPQSLDEQDIRAIYESLLD